MSEDAYFEGEPAGFLRRVCAYFIDMLIWVVPGLFILGLQQSYYELLLSFALGMAYNVAFEGSRFHATPGKLLLDLKIVNKHETGISFPTSALRYLIFSFLSVGFYFPEYSILMAPLVANGVIMLMTRKNQGIHDLMLQTTVIHVER